MKTIQNYRAKIIRLKLKLKQTDYQAIKYAEGELSEEEFAEIKAQRKAWRAEINEYEAQLQELRKKNEE